MRDPERLLELGEHALDVELLRAGRDEAPPADLLERTLGRVAAAGVAVAAVTVATTTTAASAAASASVVSTGLAPAAGSTAAGVAGASGASLSSAGAVAATKAGFFSGMSLLGKLATAVVAVSTVTVGSVAITQDPVALPAAHRAADNGRALAVQHQSASPRAASVPPGVDAPSAAPPVNEAPIAMGDPQPAARDVSSPVPPSVDDPTRPRSARVARSQPAAESRPFTLQTPPTKPAVAEQTAKSAPPATSASDLTEELKLLDRARQALLAERPAECISVLNEYRSRFPKGNLRQEASTLRIKALTANGDASQADREREKLAP